MTQSEINEIVKRHQHYINRDCENWQNMRADFRNEDLRHANFIGANLQGANFKGANLQGANFKGADLYAANFSGANLPAADFEEAILDNADFYYANLYQVDFWGSSLINTHFNYAFLIDASFMGADLTKATFFNTDCTEADFSFAKLYQVYFNDTNISQAIFYKTKNIPFIPLVCPEEGAFIGWKKVQSYIIKLEIPAGAKRSSATTRKCRCEYAKVLGIYDFNGDLAKITEVTNSTFPHQVIYKVGEMVYPDRFDHNRWNECSHGIHFFMSKQEAIDYNR